MKRMNVFAIALIILTVGLLLSRPHAQESVTLTTPIAQPSISAQSVKLVVLNFSGQFVYVEWTSNAGVLSSKTYDSTTSPTGATLLHQLNIANFSVNSFAKQVYTRLQTDGLIPAGSISGTPQ